MFANIVRPSVPDCTEAWISQRVDNFNWHVPVEVNPQYDMRYFIHDKYVPGGIVNAKVVLFYTGNEDNVELYVNNTGLMWNLGAKLNALLVFAEHRYYGKSLPIPATSTVPFPTCMEYLTTEQAMADYAYLIHALRTNITDGWDIPFIGFGGSYGGMLGSWFRMKYSDLIDGFLAASAPIWSFTGLLPAYDYNAYDEIVTRDATAAGGASDFCAENINKTWPLMYQYATTSEGRATLASSFKTCQPLDTPNDAYDLINWANFPFGYMAMGNYPYPSDYMTPQGPDSPY